MTRWTTVLREAFRRRQPSSLAAPEPRDPGLLEEARAAAAAAWRNLEEARRRDLEVSDAHLRADTLHRRNNLGPAMFRQLQGRG